MTIRTHAGGSGSPLLLALLIALTGLFWATPPASAGIIVDSGVEPFEVDSGTASDPDFPHFVGHDFMLGTLSTVNEVHWTGIYYSTLR